MGLLSFLVVTAVGATVGTLCPPLLVPAAGMLGISTTGVVAGTLAAGAQSYIGNVVAGSVFAGLQSVAMAPVLP